MKTDHRTEILAPTEENLQKCADALMAGELVGMPTETVYGLAGIAFQEAALLKIFESKERPHFDPLILHVALTKPTTADLMAEGVFSPNEMSDEAIRLIEVLVRAFWPGALTLVLPKLAIVPDLATSGLPTVAVRMPDHPIALELIRLTDSPLCAPSANQFGRLSPTTAADVLKEMNGRIPYILDGGPCRRGIESTIIEVSEDGELFCLRPGSLAIEDIEAATKVRVKRVSAQDREARLKAPGGLKNHYAPRKPLHLLDRPLSELTTVPHAATKGTGPLGMIALFGKKPEMTDLAEAMFDREVRVEILSENGDWSEAARNLFRALRTLDESDAEAIFAEPIPGGIQAANGLAFAIADRLEKAAVK